MLPGPRCPWFLMVAALAVLVSPGLALPCFAAAAPDPFAATWDSLYALDRAHADEAVESLAVSVLGRLERAGSRDTAAIARALTFLAQSRKARSLLADGRAARALDRALELSQAMRQANPAWLAWAHTEAGMIHLEMGEVDTALARIAAAVRWADRSGPLRDSLLTDARMAEGFAQRDLARWAAARDAFAAAVAAIERRRGGSDPLLVVPLSELSATLRALGDYDDAHATVTRAIRVGEAYEATDGRYLGYALSVLGNHARHTGDAAEAVEALARGVEVAERATGPGSVMTLRTLGDLAAQLESMGDEPRARALYRTCVDGLEAALGTTHRQVIATRISFANVHLTLGDTTAARGELARVDSALAARGDTLGPNVALARIVRSALELRCGRVRQAQHLALRGADALTDPAETAGARSAEVAQELYFTVRSPDDRALCDSVGRALDELRALKPAQGTTSWLSSLAARAAAEGRAGDHAGAWAHGCEADDIARERLRHSARALSDRAALQLGRTLDRSLGVLATVAGDDPARVREAWDRAIRWRGMVREIVEQRRDAAWLGDSALAGAQRAWIAASREQARLAVAGAAASDDSTLHGRYLAAAARAENAERAWARHARAAGQLPDSATLDRVLASLAPGQALVAFIESAPGEHDAALWAFVARAGTAPRCVPLGGSARIEQLVRAWLGELARPPAGTLAPAAERAATAAGEAVRRAVWDPLARELGDAARVGVVPDGPLHDLPWLALPAGGGRYLAEGRVDVAVLPAERDVLRHARVQPGSGLLAIGDPGFDAGAPAGTMGEAAIDRVRRAMPGDCRGGATRLAPLPGARDEAQDVARRWPSAQGAARLLLGADATERAFRLGAPGRRVLHLATHGVVRADSCAGGSGTRGVGGITELTQARPGRRRPAAVAPAPPTRRTESPWLEREVWLAFAGANRGTPAAHGDDDGLLTAGEVATLDLRGIERVVLSACQSGVAERWAREGVLGMRRAFHLAGVRSVVASQWPVADQATREWMAAFYGAPATATSAAMRHACRNVLEQRRRERRTTHPFYWAAFTATGE